MPRRQPKLKWPLLAGSLAAACVAAALAFAWPRLSHRLLARIAEDELAHAADSDVPGLLRKLADLGEPGGAALVRALESPRIAVARAADQALEAELDRWSRLSPEVAEPKLAVLANQLASRAENLPAAAQASARKLAMRILRWPDAGLSLDRADQISACERVLNAKSPPPLVQASRPRRVDRAREIRQAAKAPVHHREIKPRLAKWPSPTLLAEQMAAVPMPQRDFAAVPQGNEIAEPARFNPGNSMPLAAAKSSNELSDIDDIDSASLASRASREDQVHEFDRLSTLDLFARLHDDQPIAERAAAQLTRRGFTARQIEVGRHLTSPDAHERHQWVEALPGIRGVEAKAWLLHLSRDHSLAVRRAAMTLLATNRDPQVLRRMAEMAAQESDPELRAEAAVASDGIEALSPEDVSR